MSAREPILPDWTQIKRIAVFRALQLGDLLVAVPALRALREQFPEAEITLIGLPWARSFAQRFRRYLDRFVEFAGYPGIPEVPFDPARSQHFLAEQQRYRYDLAVQMHGSGQTSNPCVQAFGARITVGYYAGERPSELTLAAPYPQRISEVECNLALVALAGCRELDPRLEFPLSEEDHTEAAALLRALPRARRPWIGLHPGSRPSSRRWPAAYFAELADALADRFGAQIVLTGSPGEETTVQAVIEQMHTPALNLTGKTSLGGLAALISKLDLFVSNDTGPAHVAQAVDSPTLILFGPADYQRWAPLDQTRQLALRHPVRCSPCGYWECPIDHRCLRGLHPSIVFADAQKLLQTSEVRLHQKNVSINRRKIHATS
jgi:ADP-heptose:LPS heptosyltransferase